MDTSSGRPQVRHELKTHPQPFTAILNGFKKHEIRVNDRDFHEGDELFLREWNPETLAYTGRHVLVDITYITHGGEWGLPPNLVVMSVRTQYWSIEAAV